MTLTATRRLVIVIASAIGQRILRFERSAIQARKIETPETQWGIK